MAFDPVTVAVAVTVAIVLVVGTAYAIWQHGHRQARQPEYIIDRRDVDAFNVAQYRDQSLETEVETTDNTDGGG